MHRRRALKQGGAIAAVTALAGCIDRLEDVRELLEEAEEATEEAEEMIEEANESTEELEETLSSTPAPTRHDRGQAAHRQ